MVSRPIWSETEPFNPNGLLQRAQSGSRIRETRSIRAGCDHGRDSKLESRHKNHPWKRLSKVLDAYEVFLQVERICDRVFSDLNCIISTCTTPSSFTVPLITMSPFLLRHGPSILYEHVLEPIFILQLYFMEARQPE